MGNEEGMADEQIAFSGRKMARAGSDDARPGNPIQLQTFRSKT
jgi:hypothetical protein